jgi:hypothetical protein
LCVELFRTSITPKTQKTKTPQCRTQDLFHDFTLFACQFSMARHRYPLHDLHNGLILLSGNGIPQIKSALYHFQKLAHRVPTE